MSETHPVTPIAPPTSVFRLNRDEAQLINSYRVLPAHDRYAMRSLLFAFIEVNKLVVTDL